MKHELIVQRIKSMRTSDLDQHRLNLELYCRETDHTEQELSSARYELNLVEIELNERDIKVSMADLFRFNFK